MYVSVWLSAYHAGANASTKVYRALSPSKAAPKPRYAGVRTLFEPGSSPDGDILDANALVLHFPAPQTVTGEEVLELHVHGGPATVKAVLSAIPRCFAKGKKIRYAEPGEFTKRAFLNDRLDLAQVESLGDTLDAETEQQRRAAVRGNSGSLGRAYEDWRHQLLLARGEIEALIDFSEDQHFDESPAELLHNVTGIVQNILRSIAMHETAGQRNELLRSGIRIALLGPPNAGKSSLMNWIVGREASIVSREAGTTRDVIEARLDIGGYLCTFADTAGFRTNARSDGSGLPPTLGAVEEEGIRRARQKALGSDVVIALASIERGSRDEPYVRYDAETLKLAAGAQQRLVAINKRDSVDAAEAQRLAANFRAAALTKLPGLGEAVPLMISCKEAEAQSPDVGGLQCLVQQLTRLFASMTSLPPDLQDLLAVTERQRQLLGECRQHLDDFAAKAQPADPDKEPDIVLAAEHLRLAANCLARITGRGDSGDVEDVLGVIFEKYHFCSPSFTRTTTDAVWQILRWEVILFRSHSN